MEKAKMKILFKIPFTIYYLARVIYPTCCDNIKCKKNKRSLCVAVKDWDGKSGYYFYEISMNDFIDDCY